MLGRVAGAPALPPALMPSCPPAACTCLQCLLLSMQGRAWSG